MSTTAADSTLHHETWANCNCDVIEREVNGHCRGFLRTLSTATVRFCKECTFSVITCRLTVNNAISIADELVVVRGVSLCVDRDFPVRGHRRREPHAKVRNLAHNDLVEVHPAEHWGGRRVCGRK